MIPSLHKFNKNVKFYAATAWDLHMLKDNSIDCIVSTQVLEHLPDETKLDLTLLELKYVLNYQGRILIQIPCTKEENMDLSNRKDIAVGHTLLHTDKWWTNKFFKFFNCETTKVRERFKNSKIKLSNGKNFFEEYPTWYTYILTNKER